jgi:hypothetical protein
VSMHGGREFVKRRTAALRPQSSFAPPLAFAKFGECSRPMPSRIVCKGEAFQRGIL